MICKLSTVELPRQERLQVWDESLFGGEGGVPAAIVRLMSQDVDEDTRLRVISPAIVNPSGVGLTPMSSEMRGSVW